MKIIRLLFVSVLFLCVVIPVVKAQSVSDTDKRILELQQKVSELQGQEKNLAQQIKRISAEISLTSLRRESLLSTIAKLSVEIDELNNEIDRLEELKTKRLELALHRIPETYKRRQISEFGVLFFSKNFSDFLVRMKYLVRVQAEDTALYRQLQKTQNVYEERRGEREKKKSQREAQKVQLELESQKLARQKREQQILLDQTKNSEAVYQQLLAQAMAEKTALERALVDAVSLGPVKRGDPIALVGNTGYPGCSTGAHLHFEIRKNNAWNDPAEYLSSKSVHDEQNGGNATLGRGSWGWPLEDTIRLTQYFGKTPYSWRYSYSGGIHTGYDMVSTSGVVIRAPNDGTLYSSSQSCGSSSVIKIKYIDHGGGILSFYLHVQ